MPIYEYECRKCKHRFERIQKFSDPPIRKCPNCSSTRVEKLLSPPAVHFKGSGWYVTDYARKGSAGKGKDRDDKGAKDSGGKGGDKKSPASDSAGKSGSTSKKDKKS